MHQKSSKNVCLCQNAHFSVRVDNFLLFFNFPNRQKICYKKLRADYLNSLYSFYNNVRRVTNIRNLIKYGASHYSGLIRCIYGVLQTTVFIIRGDHNLIYNIHQ